MQPICSCASYGIWSHGHPPNVKCWVAEPPVCVSLLIFVSGSEAFRTPLDGRGYVAYSSFSGPYLVLSPVLKCGRPPKQSKSCSRCARFFHRFNQ